jgi:CRISPR/Cas system-associated exonuclease Cas4 (RecB family)
MTSMDTVALTKMRVVCGKDELAEKLQVVGRGVSTRTTVQILAGIMVRASEGRLYLSATDMEISLRVSLEAQVEDEGAVVVPGRLLVDIVRLLPGGEVTLEHGAEDGVARLTCGSASYALELVGEHEIPVDVGRTGEVALEELRLSVLNAGRAPSPRRARSCAVSGTIWAGQRRHRHGWEQAAARPPGGRRRGRALAR